MYAHYVGTRLDGTKFDSSRDRNDPISFGLGVGNVIKCWDLGFATLRVGERAILTCASEYAYGDAGNPPTIPPKSTLRFDVEFLRFEAVNAPSPAPGGAGASGADEL